MVHKQYVRKESHDAEGLEMVERKRGLTRDERRKRVAEEIDAEDRERKILLRDNFI